MIELSGKRFSDRAFFVVVINVSTHVCVRAASGQASVLEYVYSFIW